MTDALQVHPAAAVWPMMPPDELTALAESIRAVGLLEPVVLSGGMVLDGRNRLAACELAGVEPSFVTTDAEPVGYVLARNDRRRHMTKGQRALAAWLTASTTVNGDPLTIKASAVARDADVNEGMISWARTVADDGPRLLGDSLVGDVLTGAVALKEAYDQTAAARKDERLRLENLAELTTEAPDLAAAVHEDGLRIADAVYQLRQRRQAEADRRRDAQALLARILGLVLTDAEAVASWAEDIDPNPATVKSIHAATTALTTVADALEDRL